MREIKFRAWDGKRIHLNVGLWDRQAVVEEPGYEFNELRQKTGWSLMEYTGLKDKNGKEIYEGDIFSAPHDFGPGGWSTRLSSVPIDHNMNIQWQYWDVENLEVIGNIYENPELVNNV